MLKEWSLVMHKRFINKFKRLLISSLTFFSQKEVLHIGLCLPTSCGIDDTQQISSDYLYNNESIIRNVYDITVNTIEVNDLTLDPNFLYKKSLIIFG